MDPNVEPKHVPFPRARAPEPQLAHRAGRGLWSTGRGAILVRVATFRRQGAPGATGAPGQQRSLGAQYLWQVRILSATELPGKTSLKGSPRPSLSLPIPPSHFRPLPQPASATLSAPLCRSPLCTFRPFLDPGASP